MTMTIHFNLSRRRTLVTILLRGIVFLPPMSFYFIYVCWMQFAWNQTPINGNVLSSRSALWLNRFFPSSPWHFSWCMPVNANCDASGPNFGSKVIMWENFCNGCCIRVMRQTRWYICQTECFVPSVSKPVQWESICPPFFNGFLRPWRGGCEEGIPPGWVEHLRCGN